MKNSVYALATAALMLAATPACAQKAPDYAPAPFKIEEVAQFTQPWAMTFMPDGRMLVTEKVGTLRWVTVDGQVSEPISGVPEVDYGGQGGLGDVILHPDFESNSVIYLSFVEGGDGDTRGAVVVSARLTPSETSGTLSDLNVIWRQDPKVKGRGHYGHRLAFSPDGKFLFITSGERQKFTPAQDMKQNLGKVIRLYPDGSVPEDNPFYAEGGVTAQIWSYGHRNLLGLAFDAEGTLWEHEMGPRHGDEFQRIERGENYGYPVVSNGNHYDGRKIPNHDTHPEFRAPDVYWVPAISPAGLMIYQGELFPEWKGNAFVGGLSSRALVRVTFDCPAADRDICEAERYSIDEHRVREIEEGPDGSIWVLQDQRQQDGAGGMLVRLTPED